MTSVVKSRTHDELTAGLAAVERRALKAIEEFDQEYQLTGRGGRSTTRLKSKRARDTESQVACAFCLAVAYLTGEQDHVVVWERLKRQAAIARRKL